MLNYQVDDSYKIDKSEFGEGPWQTEPDKATWKDEETGLDCMIVRNEMGGLCGYVGIPLNSKLVDADMYELDVNVHGGLTYSGKCHGHICHKSDEEVFWFGFDCIHSGDFYPRSNFLVKKYGSSFNRLEFETYKDISYVQSEIKSLAKQLKELM